MNENLCLEIYVEKTAVICTHLLVRHILKMFSNEFDEPI
jgi:hypothetical protein